MKTINSKVTTENATDGLGASYDRLAARRIEWLRQNDYYHKKICSYVQFIISKGSKVLELGCGTGDLVGQLDTSLAVGVDISGEMIKMARTKYPSVSFVVSNIESFESKEVFDYVIISGTLASVKDIQKLLLQIQSYTNRDSRILITHYNEIWRPFIHLAERLRWKMPEKITNWLSADDVRNFLEISDYQVVCCNFLMLLPFYVPVVSDVINGLVAKMPFVRRLALNFGIVARPINRPLREQDTSCSVILTCRDEEENIEGLVQNIPSMGKHTEIVFVEGHSKDRTVDKINEMIKKYPEKDIKLYKQNGIGQGDAYRLGFEMATGDLLCWMEADLTIPPQEIVYFWKLFVSGQGEYINGSRFIYQMEKQAMPFLNFIGNRFFSNLFTIILGQRFTDTLCGFKAISKANYKRVKKELNYFGDFDPFGDFELIFGAIKNCLKVAEVPVHYKPRNYGEPKAYGRSFFSFVKHATLLFRMSWIAFCKFNLR